MNKYKMFKAGIDVKSALAKFDNNEEFYEKLLQDFLSSKDYEKLCIAMAQGQTKVAFEEAHKLKGTTGNLNMNTLYKSVVPLVEALRAGEQDRANELFPGFQTCYLDTVLAIK